MQLAFHTIADPLHGLHASLTGRDDSADRTSSITPTCVYVVDCISHIHIRCSGDFSQYQQTKYVMSLPGLPAKFIDRVLPDLSEAERAIAAQPGMFGRVNFSQGNAFDEAYQILQDSCVLP